MYSIRLKFGIFRLVSVLCIEQSRKSWRKKCVYFKVDIDVVLTVTFAITNASPVSEFEMFK